MNDEIRFDFADLLPKFATLPELLQGNVSSEGISLRT
jgi:hypothetical protein